jgi:carbon-monoxide dehydrogenase medium subunit
MSTDHWVVGSMVTHAELEDLAADESTATFLRHVARGIAYRAVRNSGTIGGSLCHADPAADWVTAMTALGATLNIKGRSGSRRAPVETFMHSAFETALDQDEILVNISIPRLSAKTKWAYRKYCRKTGEFALAIVAAISDPEQQSARLVFGALDGAPILINDPGLYERLSHTRALTNDLSRLSHRLTPEQTHLHQELLKHVISDLGVQP